MRRSAGPLPRRRTVIQWDDDAGASRVGNILSEDAPPYRALILAATLGVVSIFAVVAAIQYSRHGSFSQVPIVEEARANAPAAEESAAKPAATRSISAEAAKPATVTPPPRAVAEAAATAPPLQISASVAATAAVVRHDDAGSRQVAAIEVDEKQSRVATTADVAVTPAKDAAASDAPKTGDQSTATGGNEGLALAYAEDSTPSEAPIPEAAGRAEKVMTAAIAPDKPETEAVRAKPEARGSAARVRSAVFLRARPADGSAILTTIPGGAQVSVAPNCRAWCAVSYAGKRGFIYKGFLGR